MAAFGVVAGETQYGEESEERDKKQNAACPFMAL